MPRFVALYRTPDDTDDSARFEEAYRATHLPLVAATPGLVRVEVSRVRRTLVGQPAPMLMAVMDFVDSDALRAGMSSPQWAESGRNLASIGGLELATMFILEEAEVVDLEPTSQAPQSGTGAGRSEGAVS